MSGDFTTYYFKYIKNMFYMTCDLIFLLQFMTVALCYGMLETTL